MPLTEHGIALRKREMDNQPKIKATHAKKRAAKLARSGIGKHGEMNRRYIDYRGHGGRTLFLHATKGWRGFRD